MINVTVNGKGKDYPEGTTYLEISKEYKDEYPYDIILAVSNDKLVELNKIVENNCNVNFLTVADNAGHKTYLRGLKLMLFKAIYQVVGPKKISNVYMKHSIGTGYYCQLKAKVELTQELLEQIKEVMDGYVAEDIPFWKRSVETEEAIKRFAVHKMYSKEKLFQYRRVSRVNLYNLGDFEDYFYGYMPSSTAILKYFNLELYEDGFVLVIPDIKTPDKVDKFRPSPKLFSALREANMWAETMEIDSVGALNELISKGDTTDLILVQEALQEKRIAQIAEQIASSSDKKKFVMIAGPSSSGKTSFSHRLAIQLRTYGLKPHPIGVDNYFLNREFTPVDENGNYDFECLEAIDIECFNKNMYALLEGERVELPVFDFILGKRKEKGVFKQLGKNDILIIEGIHGLNEKLSYSLPEESKFKIYISALTQLNIDEHNRISTTDGRLIRRIIRDARTRGATAAHTINMWPSVRRGEDIYIFPFQEEADVMFNSALIYELSVLKQYVEPLLFGISKHTPEYMEAKRLLKFLDYFIGINSKEIPKNSILREFVGGSIFNV